MGKYSKTLGYLLILCLGLASPGLAQECTTDADCQDGDVCEVVGGSGCATAACDPEGACPEPVPCEPEEFRGCVPGPCQSDSDCAGELVCVLYTTAGGVSENCPPNADCTAEPAAAAQESAGECLPRWLAPCETSSDCGEGFTCKEAESCWCDGGGSVPDCAEGESCPEPAPAPDPECGCDPTGEFHCVLEIVECELDSECPGGMQCKENPERAVCDSARPTPGSGAGVGGAEGSAGGIDPAAGSGDSGLDSCNPTDVPAEVCVPEGYFDSYGRGDFANNEVGGEGQASSASDATEDDGVKGNGDKASLICSVSRGRGSPAQASWLLVAMAWLLRRRNNR